jgi:L-fucose isomerase-like protein
MDDLSLREAVDGCRAAGVDALLTLQTTMADARLAPTLSQIWQYPILLWATPENPKGEMISSCSLVGVHAWISILSQLGHPFQFIYGDPQDAGTMNQLRSAVRIAYAARRIRTARVGVIGGVAPGYFAMSVDPFDVMRMLGAQLQSYSLVEFADVVNGFDQNLVAEDVEKVKSLGLPLKDVKEDALPMASRLYLAMLRYLDEENLDALAVRCWPEMPNTFGQWPYLGMARLSEEGRAIACEGDADGALSLLIGESLGMGRGYLSDWLEHDAETITLWHGGLAPVSLAPSPGESGCPRVALHFNNKKPAVLESTLKAGLPITIFRLWRYNGKYLLSGCNAELIEPRRHLLGTNGLAHLDDRSPSEWFHSLCYHGMPHHVAVFQGHHTEMLRDMARIMNTGWIP